MTITTNFDSARVFSSFTDWLKQTTTFVKFKLFQDQRRLLGLVPLKMEPVA